MIAPLFKNLAKTVGLLILASCGGGGGESPAASSPTPIVASAPTPTATPTPTPAPTPTSTPTPTPTPPPTPTPTPNESVTLAAATILQDGVSIGTPNPDWGTGSTVTGGQGQTLDGVSCTAPGANYSYIHLNIYQNGQLLSLPQNIGVVLPSLTSQKGCVYSAHTRDTSGKIRIDTDVPTTLGQFFAIWGQPLSRTNVAGITTQPLKIYTNDNGTLVEYTGDPAALALLPKREITIDAGSSLLQVPTYQWQNPPPLSATPITLWQNNTIGTVYWPDGDTSTGGQGAVTADGINCEPNMSDNYHVHAHITFINNGEMLALPKYIGLPNGCYYETHTHDETGVAHIEAPAFKNFTLGNLFSVWGRPLSSTNVAGFTGVPITVYINDGGDLWQYNGDPAAIEMVSHRSITFQIGSTITEIPSYDWGASAQ